MSTAQTHGVGQLLQHRRSDSCHHTESTTKKDSTSDVHASSVGERVDEGTGYPYRRPNK